MKRTLRAVIVAASIAVTAGAFALWGSSASAQPGTGSNTPPVTPTVTPPVTPPAAGSAAAKPAEPTVFEVDCATVKPIATVSPTLDGKGFIVPKQIEVQDVLKFQLSPGVDVVPDEDLGLAVGDGATKCLKFTKGGLWKFHTTAKADAVGSAAPLAKLVGEIKVRKPNVTEVDCAKFPPIVTITSNGTGFTPALQSVTVNDVIKFQMPAQINVTPNTNLSDAGLRVASGKTVCLQFLAPGPGAGGEYKYHSDPAGFQGQIYAKYWFDLLANKPIEEYNNFWLPKAVNLAADESDLMYIAVLALSIFFFVAITGVVVYFVIKYRHRPGHKAQPSAAHNDALEITWTIIPTIICVFLFYYGWHTYVRVVTPPTKAVEIQLQAWRWNWEFKHGNGVTDSDLHVPVNAPVRIVMTSRDVLHSFYAPVMRVKQDIIPRRYTYAWFYATKPGTYRLTCAEYCGQNHSRMAHTDTIPPDLPDGRLAVVVVHEPGGYERYLSDKQAAQNTMEPKQLGALLYDKKGCVQCHTTDGTARVGPSFKQPDWGKMIGLADGSQVKMDENYVQESIYSPQAKARPGFPPSMPSFEGQLKPAELEGLIAFIRSLKE